MKSNLLRIMALVAAVVLLVVVVGGLLYTCVVANKVGAWPVYVFVGVLFVFGWDNLTKSLTKKSKGYTKLY